MKIAVLAGPGDQAASAQAAVDALLEAGHDSFAVAAGGDMYRDLAARRPDAVLNAAGETVLGGAAWSLAKSAGCVCVGSSDHACRLAADACLLPGAMDAYRQACGGDLTASWLEGACVSREAFRQWGACDFLPRLAEQALGFPLCVKPAVGGSAACAEDAESLERALDGALSGCGEAFVRQWVEGVELRACILGTGWDAYVLPLVEVACTGEGVSFKAPVDPSSLSADAGDAQAIVFEIERAALEVYRAFGMSGYGVVDMVWDGGQARVLNVQAYPSMAPGREFQAACAAAGLSMPAVLDALAQDSF